MDVTRQQVESAVESYLQAGNTIPKVSEKSLRIIKRCAWCYIPIKKTRQRHALCKPCGQSYFRMNNTPEMRELMVTDQQAYRNRKRELFKQGVRA